MLFPIPCNVLHNVIHFNWILSFRCVSFDSWQVSCNMYTITYALNQPSSRLSRNNLYSFVLLSAKTNRILLLFSNFICFQYFTFIACLGKYFIHPPSICCKLAGFWNSKQIQTIIRYSLISWFSIPFVPFMLIEGTVRCIKFIINICLHLLVVTRPGGISTWIPINTYSPSASGFCRFVIALMSESILFQHFPFQLNSKNEWVEVLPFNFDWYLAQIIQIKVF